MGGGANPSVTEDSRPELPQTPGGAGGPPGLENGQTYSVRPSPGATFKQWRADPGR